MDAISTMVDEHKNIKRMLKVIRAMSIRALNNGDLNYEDFYKVIDFVRNYADRHHHAKEEAVLFKKMGDELGEKISKGPVAGMLVEHDMGRLYMSNLEAALSRFDEGEKDCKVDIIANSICYTDLLNRHIDKEDTTIYTFARRGLSKASMEEVDEKCEKAEEEAAVNGILAKYTSILQELEKKYL